MRLSDVSIERPVLATVLNLLIVVAGVIAFRELPLREYPDVELPVVSVRTIYPGASPETVEATVTEPLEQVLNAVDDIHSLESTSAFGMSFINIQFDAGRDIDLASTDVSNALQRVLGQLPDGVQRPILSKASSSGVGSMWIALKGERYSSEDLTDMADRVVRPMLQMIPGVARVEVAGARRLAMRVWLDPVEMAAHSVDAADVQRAIRANNLQVPAGEIEAAARKFTVNVRGHLEDPRDYEQIVIREENGIPIRIGDVGWVELGAEDYRNLSRHNGEPIVALGIRRQSHSNELDVAAAVRERLPEMGRALPEGVRFDIAIDNSIFVEASLREVAKTLGIVFLLVVLVNLFFLHSPTSTAITAVAIPVSLVGTMAVLLVLDFSINVLSLLAMVLAIGLLVDDSIVVMENIYRRREAGETHFRAALNGAREVGFPVIATTIAVVSVLIPLSMMEGNTGRLFREFALTMATAIVISTFVALTLVPMLCARYLSVRSTGRVSRGIEALLGGITGAYQTALSWSLRHRMVAGIFMLATLGALYAVFDRIPRTLVPLEDRGSWFAFVKAPQGSTGAYTFQALRQTEERIQQIPEVHGFFGTIASSFMGPSNTADGMVYVRMKPWGERTRSQQEIVAEVTPDLLAIPGALVLPVQPPSLGQMRQNDIHVVLKSSQADLDELRVVTDRILARVRDVPGLINVDTDLKLDNPQLDIEFDRERAADIGVPVSSVADSLRLLVSQTAADEFVLRNRQYDVVTALAGTFRSVPEQLGEIHVRAYDGAMVPLSSVIRVEAVTGPTLLNHYDMQRSAAITANLMPGATLGEALPAVLQIIDEELPEGFGTALSGISREYVESGSAVFVTFGIALLVIYLVLAAQFESFVHPLTVLFGVPLASLGALLALYVTGNTFNLYSQVGIILLVGLVTKNSILLVDFANQERARGKELVAALASAGRTRFRPILMTSATSVFGAVPLMLATGAGAESRQPIGTVVVGGLIFSTVFTLLVTPVVHYVVTRVAERAGLSTIPPAVKLDIELPALPEEAPPTSRASAA